MAYIENNPKSKAEIRRWIKDPERTVRIQANSPFPAALLEAEPTFSGQVTIEGPHYPKPHTWWGTAKVVDGQVVEVK